MKTMLITLALASVAALAATPTSHDRTGAAVVYQARQRVEAGPRSIGSGKLPTYFGRQRIDQEPLAIGSGKLPVYRARQRVDG